MILRIANLCLDFVDQFACIFVAPFEYSCEDSQRIWLDGFEHLVLLDFADFFHAFVFGPGADWDLSCQLYAYKEEVGEGTNFICIFGHIDKASFLHPSLMQRIITKRLSKHLTRLIQLVLPQHKILSFQMRAIIRRNLNLVFLYLQPPTRSKVVKGLSKQFPPVADWARHAPAVDVVEGLVSIQPFTLHIINLKATIRGEPRGLNRTQICAQYFRPRIFFCKINRPCTGPRTKI